MSGIAIGNLRWIWDITCIWGLIKESILKFLSTKLGAFIIWLHVYGNAFSRIRNYGESKYAVYYIIKIVQSIN